MVSWAGSPPASTLFDGAVVLLPGARRLALGVLELAVVAGLLARRLDRRPEEAGALVAQDVLLGVVGAGVLAGAGLGVLRVVALHQPVVALGGVRADVVGVVVEAELAGQRVLVRRHLLAELREARVAVALGHVAVDLVVGPVLLDQQEDVLDGRRVADPPRDGHRLHVAGCPSACFTSVSPGAPAVLGEDPRGVRVADVPVAGEREPGQRGGRAVGAVRRRRRGAEALVGGDLRPAGVDAPAVRDHGLAADVERRPRGSSRSGPARRS